MTLIHTKGDFVKKALTVATLLLLGPTGMADLSQVEAQKTLGLKNPVVMNNQTPSTTDHKPVRYATGTYKLEKEVFNASGSSVKTVICQGNLQVPVFDLRGKTGRFIDPVVHYDCSGVVDGDSIKIHIGGLVILDDDESPTDPGKTIDVKSFIGYAETYFAVKPSDPTKHLNLNSMSISYDRDVNSKYMGLFSTGEVSVCENPSGPLTCINKEEYFHFDLYIED